VEIRWAEAKLERGTLIEAEDMAGGNEIFIVTDEERIAMPVGEYQLEDGQELVVEEEGIIAKIGQPAEEEEVEVEASEQTEELAEDDKEEMGYATKEELAEVKSMIEEIKAMIESKEEMSSDDEEEAAEEAEPKEELSAQTPVEKITHNPETESKKKMFLYGNNGQQSTMSRVLSQMNRINK